ncbi:uncharacterized protein TNCV_830781 [Trichonephila clavipes]|nr:uncharacterized protein TNCV_830781 [Trichonephila clavipes]
MVGRHIIEDIVGRVAQYVDEHYPVDKWHLGDLIAWVAQSALKYRPRICELSKCLEGPLKMIVCPKKLLPTLSHLCEIAVCRSTINAGSDRWPVRLQTRAVVISMRLNRDSSPKMTRLQSVTLQVARGRQKSSRHCLLVSVLADVGSSSQLVSRLLMVSLDGTGCLEGAYIDVLRHNLLDSAKKLSMENTFIFQQDNDPKHTDIVTKTWWLYHAPRRLETPPQSPDLNPIENLRMHLDTEVRKKM